MNSDFNDKKFRAYEAMDVYPEGFDNYCVPCMLLAVDFEQQLFKLIPIPDGFYEEIPFWCRAEYCKRPRGNPELKIVKYGGAKDFVPCKKKTK